jgi:hypothetical protein
LDFYRFLPDLFIFPENLSLMQYIYLTNLEENDRIRFPVLPKEIQYDFANQFHSYSILSIGAVKLPSGQELNGFRWDGMFPGKARERDPYVREWKEPKELYKWLENCKKTHGKSKKLRLLITETPINFDVYLEDFSGTFSGGCGDYNYKISFIQAKDLTVSASGGSGSSGANQNQSPARPSPSPAKTYTVVKGDSLWKIAQKFMGNGARYTELHEANRSIIGANPSLIYPGQVLTIPG